MRMIARLILVSAGWLTWSAVAEEGSPLAHRWQTRFDIGGSLPFDAPLTETGGPVASGRELKLSSGIQFDFAAGYRVTPWLTLEAELGFTDNKVDSVGNWSYPNSSLSQMALMANVVVQYPRGRLVPFAGFGAGGVYSGLSFGNYYAYYYSDSDGYGDDFVAAFQAFGGVRYQFHEQWSVGVVYRFLATGSQNWNVKWWDGSSFHVGVDSIHVQSISLVVTGSF